MRLSMSCRHEWPRIATEDSAHTLAARDNVVDWREQAEIVMSRTGEGSRAVMRIAGAQLNPVCGTPPVSGLSSAVSSNACIRMPAMTGMPATSAAFPRPKGLRAVPAGAFPARQPSPGPDRRRRIAPLMAAYRRQRAVWASGAHPTGVMFATLISGSLVFGLGSVGTESTGRLDSGRTAHGRLSAYC